MSAVAEGWREIPGLEGRYFASREGAIRGPTGRTLSLKTHKHGYRLFGVADGKGGSCNVSVARSVCAAFNGPPQPGQEVDHIDHNRARDTPENLRWVSKSENLAHRRIAHGSAHTSAKLTEADVLAIRASMEPSPVLAAQYGVARRTISDARSGRHWRHVA